MLNFTLFESPGFTSNKMKFVEVTKFQEKA